MKCFLVVNQLNDPFYIDHDVDFAEYIVKRAKMKGLLEPDAEVTELDTNLVMQLFSPLVLSQWMIIDRTKEPCSSIYCPNGFRFVFRHVDELLFLAINGDDTESEAFLHRKIQAFITVMRFMFGPVSEEMGQAHQYSKRAKWNFLQQLMRNWSDMIESEQSFLVEAIERLHVNQVVSEKCMEALEKSVKQFQATREHPVQHAVLFANSKLLALYSRTGARELCAKDILALMILSKTMHPHADRLEDLFSKPYTDSRSKSTPSTTDELSDGGEDEFHSAPNTPGAHRSRSSSTGEETSNNKEHHHTFGGSIHTNDTFHSTKPPSDCLTYIVSASESDARKDVVSSDQDSLSQLSSSSEKLTLLEMYKAKYKDAVFSSEFQHLNSENKDIVKEDSDKQNEQAIQGAKKNQTMSVEVVVHQVADLNDDHEMSIENKTEDEQSHMPEGVGDSNPAPEEICEGGDTQDQCTVFGENVTSDPTEHDNSIANAEQEEECKDESVKCMENPVTRSDRNSVATENLPSSKGDTPDVQHENVEDLSQAANVMAGTDSLFDPSNQLQNSNQAHTQSPEPVNENSEAGSQLTTRPSPNITDGVENQLIMRSSPITSDTISRPSSTGHSSKTSRASTLSSEQSNEKLSSVSSSRTTPSPWRETRAEPSGRSKGISMRIESPRLESDLLTMPSFSTIESSVVTSAANSSITVIRSSNYLPQTVFLETRTCLYSPYNLHTVQISPGVTIVLLSQAHRHALADPLLQVIHTVQDLIYGRRTKLPRSRSTHVYEIINSLLAKLQNSLRKSKGSVRKLSQDIHSKWEKEEVKQRLLDFLERDATAPIPPQLESPMLELYKKLRELFAELFLTPVSHSSQLWDDALSQLRGRISTELVDYREYLNVKAQRNITMTTYIDEFPGLVHFIFIDRHYHQMTAPSLNISLKVGERMDATTYLKEKIWYMYQHMMAKLTEGYTTVMMRDGDFYFSYFLWFEDYKGNPVPVQESFKPSKKLPYPGVLCGSFYRELVHQCFPHAIPDAVRCNEMFLMHLGTVHPQYIAGHCKRLAYKMWEMSGETYSSVGLL